MKSILYAIILSMLPVSEVRGGIPLARIAGATPVEALIYCTLANIAIIPAVFLFLDYLHGHFMKIGIYSRLFNRYLERVRKKVGAKTTALTYFYLLTFVAIPFPATGAYTGCIIAWFFKMQRLKSMIAIALGVVVAGIVVTLAAMGIFSFASLF